tara:strand:- start:395 stop:664 length:270 start_codon:yes stop_codon:yes gene_type:complete
MNIERNEKEGTRTITLAMNEAAIVFHHEGVTFDGLNPKALAKNPEAMTKILEVAPHLCDFFDAAEFVHTRINEENRTPWNATDDFTGLN